jgi:uncharacterized protein (DUF1778 family)
MATTPEREDVITVRLSRDERHMVKALAGADGISVSDVVRMCIRRAHAERFGAEQRGTSGR